MYIDKWWGNTTCGDTDDSMLLMDYFEMKNKEQFTLKEIIHDAQLDNVLGKKPLYVSEEIECFFWMDGDEDKFHADFQIPVNLIIDLSALLLQSFVEGFIAIEHMGKKVKFSISTEKEELKLIIDELENAVQKPGLYYPDFLQDEFAEMKDGIIEICNELKAYC